MKHQVIDSISSLDALFGVVGEASLRKEVSYLHVTYQAMIKASPFLVLATAGPNGLDVSPRILVSPDLLKQFEVQGAVPKCVIEVRVEAVFFSVCARHSAV